MRTACKSAYNKSAMLLQCTHEQRSKRKFHLNWSKETITFWSIRKRSVSRPSDVQWVEVVRCTEPREAFLNGKLQSSLQCIIIRAPMIWPIIDSHRFPVIKFLDRNWQTLAGIACHYAPKITSKMALLLLRTNTWLLKFNKVNKLFIFLQHSAQKTNKIK